MPEQPVTPGSPSLVRAMRMRCPMCGHKPITTGFGEIVDECPRCGSAFAQGEEGYYVGALIMNMAVCLLSFVVTFLAAIAITWPDVPWNGVLVLCLAVMVIVPTWFYPRSKTSWIWLDHKFLNRSTARRG